MAVAPSRGRANGIEGVAAPESQATRELYEQYGNQIFRYCLHQLGSREEAEDAVQSTFLNAFRGLRRGVVPELESAWLFKIAHNVCLSRRRSTWRRGRIESPADFEVVEELAPAPSSRADELIGLQDVLERLPENQRRAILLREWQGLSYREIAAELELTQAAVETLIFRARRALATGLEQPPAPRRRRLLRAADWGNAAAALKSFLVGGSVAAKVAATALVVGATTVVAAAPVEKPAKRPPAPVVSHARSVPAAGAASATAPVSKAPAAPAPAAPPQAHVPKGASPVRDAPLQGAAQGAHGLAGKSASAHAHAGNGQGAAAPAAKAQAPATAHGGAKQAQQPPAAAHATKGAAAKAASAKGSSAKGAHGRASHRHAGRKPAAGKPAAAGAGAPAGKGGP